VTGFFYNPNIQPLLEFRRRMDTLEDYARQTDVPVLWHRNYGLARFLREVVFREQDRCRICYFLRLSRTAQLAVSEGFEGFTTTLLYSRFQNHELVRTIGKQLAKEHRIPFVYMDFREGWREGIAASRKIGLYRQPYCGCVYSEAERYGSIGALKEQ
jgi:hypothetical protein